MRSVVLVTVLGLSGCATAPAWLAHYYDTTDPCQSYNKSQDHMPPGYCGSARSTVQVRDTSGRVIGTIGR